MEQWLSLNSGCENCQLWDSKLKVILFKLYSVSLQPGNNGSTRLYIVCSMKKFCLTLPTNKRLKNKRDRKSVV